MLRNFFTFRSGREKNIFIVITLVVLIILTAMVVVINQGQALINDNLQEAISPVAVIHSSLIEQVKLDQENKQADMVLIDDSGEIMKVVKVTGEVGQNNNPSFINLSPASAGNNVRRFTVLGSNGTLIPRMINVDVNDVVMLDFTALDDDYDFVLDGHYLNQSCKEGESSKIIFQAIKEGKFHYYCSSCSDIMASAGQLVVN